MNILLKYEMETFCFFEAALTATHAHAIGLRDCGPGLHSNMKQIGVKAKERLWCGAHASAAC